MKWSACPSLNYGTPRVVEQVQVVLYSRPYVFNSRTSSINSEATHK